MPKVEYYVEVVKIDDEEESKTLTIEAAGPYSASQQIQSLIVKMEVGDALTINRSK